MWSEGEEDDISDGELMDLSELVQGILSSEGVTLKEKAESSEAIPIIDTTENGRSFAGSTAEFDRLIPDIPTPDDTLLVDIDLTYVTEEISIAECLPVDTSPENGVETGPTLTEELPDTLPESVEVADDTSGCCSNDGVSRGGEAIGEPSTSKIRKRKPIPEKHLWTREDTKIKRQAGEAYVGYRRKDKKCRSVLLHDAPKQAKKMGSRCKVEGKCERWSTRHCSKITDEARKSMFEDFWKMTWGEKKIHVSTLVQADKPKQKVGNGRNDRDVSYSYHLRIDGKNVAVCRTMFLNTLGLKYSTIRHWIRGSAKIGSSELTVDQLRREAAPQQDEATALQQEQATPPQPQSNRSIKVLKERNLHLDSFLKQFPKLPSHYCRQSTEKLYLQTDVTSMAQFYELYCANANENGVSPLNRCNFHRKCKAEKITIFSPRKDQCNVCFKHKMGNVSSDDYHNHIDMKNRAREEKANDKLLAQKGDIHVICCDVMAVKLLPFIQASISYYKMKLAIHNYTVYNLGNHDVMCFWFTESETNLQSSVFASCLIEEIERLLDTEKKEVVIYSDGANYQNRNCVLSNALLALSVKRQVVINQKILEKGHTQMEADSVHSVLESAMKKKEIFLPHELVSLTKEARKASPYRSKLMYHDDFVDYSGNLRYTSIRPGNKPHDPVVTDIRWLQYDPAGIIRYKLKFDDGFQDLPRRPRASQVDVYPQLHNGPLAIPKDKWDDLQSLKPCLPKESWNFYDNLPHQSESIRKAKRESKKPQRKD